MAGLPALRGATGAKEPSRFVTPLVSFFLALIALGKLSHLAAVVAEVGMIVIFAILVVEFARPQLQVRKALPNAEITLNLNGPSD